MGRASLDDLVELAAVQPHAPTSHVLPALIRKVRQARAAGAPSITFLGSGTPLREFLHIDDLADALVHLLTHYSGEVPANVVIFRVTKVSPRIGLSW